MTPSSGITALHAFLGRPGLIEQFERVGPASWKLPRSASVCCVFLYSDAPKLVRLRERCNLEWFDYTLRQLTGNCGSTHEVARVWAGLIALHGDPQAYAAALEACPALAELEALPALGWRAYAQLLNDTYPQRSELVGLSKFQAFEDRIDCVYIGEAGMMHYIERLPLMMPATPKTLGEELRALPGLMAQARRLCRACDARGEAFNRQAPARFKVQFAADYRKAVERTAHDRVPTWVGVLDQLQQCAL